MKYGFYAPNFGFCGDARLLASLAREAEEAGWDGFFLWDHLQFIEPAVDPWVALAAMALSTERIRLGTLVTPLPRRHIAKLAREIISIDRLSNGRMIFGVGAGFPQLPDYAAFGDETDLKARAAKLDEGLDVLNKLMSGEPVSHHGAHYNIECGAFQRPLQQPRVPIWIAASWPAQKPLRRAVRWDGVAAVAGLKLEVESADIAQIAAFAARERAGAPFDITRFGITANATDTGIVAACAEAGATWWLEYVYAHQSTLEALRARLHAGPPRL